MPAGTLMPNVTVVRVALTTNAQHRYQMVSGMRLAVGQRLVPSSVNVSQGDDSSNKSSATGSRVYRFQKLMSPVNTATKRTSNIGCFLMAGIRRKVFAQ